MVRPLVVVVALALFTGLVSPVAAVAADQERLVDEAAGVAPAVEDPVPVPWESDLDLSIPEQPADRERNRPGWTVGSGSVSLDAGAQTVAVPDVPVTVKADERASGSQRNVDVDVVPADVAEQFSPVGAAIALDISEVAGQRASWDGLELVLDYSDIPIVGGGDLLGRLELTQYSGCRLTEGRGLADRYVCAESHVIVDAMNDTDERSFSFSLDDVDVSVPETTTRLASGLLVPVPADSTTVVALTAGASSESGDFTATKFASVLDYQVGLFSGSAELSYPIEVPPAEAGPTPSVVLSYSSASVDGMNPRSNTQAGLIGLGWSYNPGSIARALTGCTGGSHLCKGTDGDLNNDFSLELNGVASALVYDGVNAAGNDSFRLKNDPHWKVERHTGAPEEQMDAAHEYWTVTTTDGTVYTFGKQIELETGVDQKSVLYTHVADDPANGQYRRAYQWNLDRIEDPDGNLVSFYYDYELNTYGSGTEYVRAAYLTRIEYGKHVTSAEEARTRVLFNTEWRCGTDYQGFAFSDCADNFETSFSDSPLDLRYNSNETAPTFFTERRLGSIQVQTRHSDTSDWVTAGFYDLQQWFPAQIPDPEHPDPEDPEHWLEVEQKLWLQRIYNRGGGYTDDDGNEQDVYNLSAFEQIEAEYHQMSSCGYNTDVVSTTDIGGGSEVSFPPGGEIRFDDVDFSAGAGDLLVRVAADGAFIVQFATSKHGEPFATLTDYDGTGGDYVLYRFSDGSAGNVVWTGSPSGLTDTHDIYIDVFEYGSSSSTSTSFETLASTVDCEHVGLAATASLNWFRFKPQDITPYNGSRTRTTHYPAENAVVLNNRAGTDGVTAGLPMLRIGAVKNELGGEIIFGYPEDTTQSTTWRSCAGASTPLNGSYFDNDYHCYPVWDDSGDEGSWIVTPKWVVESITLKHPETGYDPATTRFEYGTPRWALTISPVKPLTQNTWNTFRGHDSVTVTHPDGSTTTHWFYQGMNGDLGHGFNQRPTESLSLPDWFDNWLVSPSGWQWPAGTDVSEIPEPSLDQYWLAGREYLTEHADSTGEWLSYSYTAYSEDDSEYVTAGSGLRDAARFVAAQATQTQTQATGDSPGSITSVQAFYYDDGNLVGVRDEGDFANSGDETFLSRAYTNVDEDAWIRDKVQHERLWDGINPGTLHDGNEVWINAYKYDGLGLGVSPTKGHLTIERHWSVRGPDSSGDHYAETEYSHDTRGRLAWTDDPEESHTTLTYGSANGLLDTTSNDLSWAANYAYDEYRRATTVTDPNSRVIAATRDRWGRVTTVDPPVLTGDPEPIVGYEYRDFDKMDPDASLRVARLTTSTRVDGNWVESVEYVDGFGQVFQTDTTSPNAGHRMVTRTLHDEMGRVYRTTEPYEVSGEPGSGIVSIVWNDVDVYYRYDYDDAGNLIYEELYSNGTEWFVDIDVMTTGSVSVIDEAGDFTTCTCVLTETTERGSSQTDTRAFHDIRGNLRRVDEYKDGLRYATTYYGYDLSGRLTAVKDDAGNDTSIEYDMLGRKTSMSDPDMGVWAYSYDDVGNLETQTDAEGTGTTFVYDELHRLESRSALGETATWTYYTESPDRGFLQSDSLTIGTESVVNHYDSYDDGGRLEEQRLVVPGQYGGTYAINWQYDDAGTLQSVQYPGDNNGTLGEIVTYDYNTLGQPVTLTGNDTYSDDDYVSATGYTTWGALESQTFGSGVGEIDLAWSYLTNRRLDSISATESTDAILDLTYGDYDPNGNIVSIYDAVDGQRQCFGYDDLDRLTSAYTTTNTACGTANSGGTAPYNLTFGYNEIGNLTSRSDIAGTYNYEGATGGPHAVNTIGPDHTYEYNDNGDLTYRNIEGFGEDLTWTADRRLKSVAPEVEPPTEPGSHYPPSTTYTYDANGNRVLKLVDDGDTTATVYVAGLYEYTYELRYDELGEFDIDPVSLGMLGVAGGVPATAEVLVSEDSPDTPEITVSAQSVGDWLSVEPGTGTTPVTLTVTANPVELTAGSYEGEVTVSGDGYADGTIPVTFTVDSPPGAVVATEQSNTGASSAASFTATLPTSPTVGDLLVIGIAGGRQVDIDLSETGWVEARRNDDGSTQLWYRVADGTAADNDVVFEMSGVDQYAWVFSEYSSTSGWGAAPLDVTGSQPTSGWTDGTDVTSGTTDTPSGDGLGVAMFKIQAEGEETSLSFTNDYVLVGSDGTEFPSAWSLQGFMAANTATMTVAQESTATWDGTLHNQRTGVIAVFLPDSTQLPALSVAPSTVELSGVDGGSNVSAPVDLSVSEGTEISFTTDTGSDAWLSVVPVSGTVSVGSPVGLTITGDPTVAGPGVHEGIVTVTAAGYRDATVEVTFTVDPEPGGSLIVVVQSDTGAGSSSTFTATAGAAPVAGDLLVIGVAGGGDVTMDGSESTWTKAQAADSDQLAVWYKVADGDTTDDNVGFSMSSTNQYSWVYAEYASTVPWGADPLDVSAFEPNSGDTGDTQVSSGTTTTPSGDGLGIAMFRLRDGDAAADVALTNSYSLVESDGTQFGQPYSLEAVMAANTATTTLVQESTLSWTNGDRTGRTGVIAVFIPNSEPPAPVLEASPSPLELTAQEDGSQVVETVTVSASDSEPVPFTVSDDADWLSLSPGGGTTQAGIAAAADPTGLTPGTYTATITIVEDVVGDPTYTGTTVDVVFEVTPAQSGSITVEQSNSGAGSSSTFTATADTTPVAGDLLVIGVAGGGDITIDPAESTWTKAQAADTDQLAIWYKVADGNASDDDISFTMSSTNQYSWVFSEYSASDGWGTNPLDVSAFEPNSGYTGDDQIISGTTTTPSGDGLGVAMFRLRDGDTATDVAFTNNYMLVDSDGTQFGQPWSLEGIMATNTNTDTTTQETTMSWSNGDRTGRTGVITVFLPAGQQPAAAAQTSSTTAHEVGSDVIEVSGGDRTVNAVTAGLVHPTGGVVEATLGIAPPQPEIMSAMTLVTTETVTETWYYQYGGRLVAMRQRVDDVDQGVEFLISDHLGSTTISYDPATDEVTRQYYNPWGGLRGASEPVLDTDIGYTGQRLDTSTDLMYYQARYYDPAIGRFISADTIIPNPADPQDLNRYSYVNNNPIRYSDRTGHIYTDFDFDDVAYTYDVDPAEVSFWCRLWPTCLDGRRHDFAVTMDAEFRRAQGWDVETELWIPGASKNLTGHGGRADIVYAAHGSEIGPGSNDPNFVIEMKKDTAGGRAKGPREADWYAMILGFHGGDAEVGDSLWEIAGSPVFLVGSDPGGEGWIVVYGRADIEGTDFWRLVVDEDRDREEVREFVNDRLSREGTGSFGDDARSFLAGIFDDIWSSPMPDPVMVP